MSIANYTPEPSKLYFSCENIIYSGHESIIEYKLYNIKEFIIYNATFSVDKTVCIRYTKVIILYSYSAANSSYSLYTCLCIRRYCNNKNWTYFILLFSTSPVSLFIYFSSQFFVRLGEYIRAWFLMAAYI